VPRFGDRRRARIGLLGGSFNPAHAGHRHVAEVARRRLRLDQVWLLVSPGNPLKPQRGMAKLALRVASARGVADGRRVVASDIESRLGTRFTVDTLRLLQRRFPRVDFVWIAGADIFVQLPRWRGWRDLVRRVPFAVLPRPGYNHRAVAGRAAAVLRHARRPARASVILARCAPPAWVFLTAPQNAASASAIRATLPGATRARFPAATRAPRPGATRAPHANATRAPHPTAIRTPLASAADTVTRSRAITRPPSPPTRKRASPRKPAKPKLPAADKTPGTPRKKAAVAGPRAGARRTPPAEPSALDRLQRTIVASLEDDKAEAVVTLDLVGKASFCDRMVIATGLADRQITAMAQHLSDKLEQAGVKRIQVEGAAGADWVLIDAGDIVVHLFKPEARAMYALEKMWGADLDEVTSAG
jgi:nicotinate-nucleotide adenylyltransferase